MSSWARGACDDNRRVICGVNCCLGSGACGTSTDGLKRVEEDHDANSDNDGYIRFHLFLSHSIMTLAICTVLTGWTGHVLVSDFSKVIRRR